MFPCLFAQITITFCNHLKVYEKARAFGSGLLHKGVKPGKDSFIGIYSKNKIEVSIILDCKG